MSGRIVPNGVVREHRDAVSCVALSPCGAAVLSGSASGEVLLWAADTRRVLFSLPAGCSHGDKGILQVAFLPPRPSGTTVHPPDSASFLTMGRDGSIRFWGIFSGDTAVTASDILDPTSTVDVAPGRAEVADTTATATEAAPPYPLPDADFGDMAFMQRPTKDVSFAWDLGGTAGSYSVRCVATLWHSSYTFCKFELSAKEERAVLVVPADAENKLRMYQLWGEAPKAVQVESVVETAVPVVEEVSSLFGGPAPPPPQQPAAPIQKTTEAQRYLQDLVREANKVSGVSPEDVLVPAVYLCDIDPPAESEAKVGVPMSCTTLTKGPTTLICVGYESGHFALTLVDLTEMKGPATRQHFKVHSEPVLAVAAVWKNDAGKFLLATGGADTSLVVWGGVVKDGGFSLTKLKTMTLPKAGAASICFHPSNVRMMAVGCWDNVVRVYDTKTGAQLAALEQHNAAVSTALWGTIAGRAALLTASNDTTVALWDVYS